MSTTYYIILIPYNVKIFILTMFMMQVTHPLRNGCQSNCACVCAQGLIIKWIDYWYRKNKKPATAHKCVIYNLAYFSLLQNYWADFYEIHILVQPYTQSYIPNLKEITPVVSEVPESCQIFFVFFFAPNHNAHANNLS